jgi:hypothetical protein
MMEDHEFCDSCPGCRPALADPTTMRPMPQDHPTMVEVNRIWDNETSYEQRKAFIEVTLHNSRETDEIKLAQEVVQLIQNAIQ